MKVKTVDDKEFRSLCVELRQRVGDSGYDYDMTVAVATAGIEVAKGMGITDFYVASCRREGSSAKRGTLRKIIKKLPRGVNDILRKLEQRFLSIFDKKNEKLRKVEIDKGLREKIKSGVHNILIVDDAVDSGRTLRSVIEALREESPKSEIRSAVITSTRRDPIQAADYALYDDEILIRFPWAADF